MSHTYRSFVANVSSATIPQNIHEALRQAKWKQAVMEEMEALKKNGTWEVVDLPKEKRLVGCKWLFTIKYNSDGSINRYKARLVAKGFTQSQGIDYQETFAPVAKLNSINILLSLAANLDWKLHQLDIKNAFFNGDLEEEVFMSLLPGFDDDSDRKVCKLKKSLYGLKQSPRAWFKRFTKTVKQQWCLQGQADHTLFTKFSATGKIAILIVYVDDIIMPRETRKAICHALEVLQNKSISRPWRKYSNICL